MKCIVVGLDGSPTSLLAFRWAGSLAAAAGAELRAVASLVPSESELRPERLRALREELEAQLRGWCAPASEELGVECVTEVVDGDPRTALREVAARREADALVVGSVGVTGAAPGLLRLGSVVEHLVHHSQVPIVVVPPSAHPRTERIVVAVDGSEHAGDAARWCGAVAAATGAEVTVVTVARQLVGGWEQIPERRLLRDWAAGVREAGVSATASVVHDADPANGILTEADALDADLVVVGMRGLGGFLGLRVGGVAMKVLHRAERTLALIPPRG